MTGKVTIQWCPGCKAWNKCDQIGGDILEHHTLASDLGLIAFEYFRKDQRCDSCSGDFVTTNLKQCDPQHLWKAHAELGNIRKSLFFAGDLANGAPEIVSWDVHPELADFSAAFITD